MYIHYSFPSGIRPAGGEGRDQRDGSLRLLFGKQAVLAGVDDGADLGSIREGVREVPRRAILVSCDRNAMNARLMFAVGMLAACASTIGGTPAHAADPPTIPNVQQLAPSGGFLTAGTTTFTANTTSFFGITVDSSPVAKITLEGQLPDGLRFIDNGTNTASISGKPWASAPPLTVVKLVATNGSDRWEQQLNILVRIPPILMFEPNVEARLLKTLAIPIQAVGIGPIQVVLQGTLPRGVVFVSDVDGYRIWGAPEEVGVFQVTIVGSDRSGMTAARELTLTVTE